MSQTILLIDDSAILRRIAANVLGGHPVRYEVVTATRAAEGFARACGTHPDLVLVDAHLAGTAKAELCQRFLAEPRTAKLPVVLLMGQGALSPAFNELPENVVDTLSKPFTPEQLIASVRAILGAAREDGDFASVRAKLRGREMEVPVLVDRLAVTAAANHDAWGNNGGRVATVGASILPAGKRTRPVATQRVLSASPERSLRAEFQKVAADKASGVLSLALPDKSPLEVYFDSGKLVVVTTRDASDYSRGALGVLPAKVSPATLEAAEDEQRGSGVPFFLTLGARGLLSKASAVDLLHRFGQQFFSRVWLMRGPAAQCKFRRLDALPGFALRLEPRKESIPDWLLGTLRHLSAEDVATASKHDGFVGTPSLPRHDQALLESLDLTAPERDFVRRVNGKNDLPGIAKGLGITSENAYLLLYRFRALDLMDYRPAPAAYVVTPRTNVRRVLPLQR